MRGEFFLGGGFLEPRVEGVDLVFVKGARKAQGDVDACEITAPPRLQKCLGIEFFVDGEFGEPRRHHLWAHHHRHLALFVGVEDIAKAWLGR